MSDEFEKLRDAMQRPSPAPDPAGKEAALQLAMKNFDRLHQGTATDPRPTQDRPQKPGFLRGVRSMLATLTTRPILTATTSAAALCLGLIVVLPLNGPKPDALIVPPKTEGRADLAASGAAETLHRERVASEPEIDLNTTEQATMDDQAAVGAVAAPSPQDLANTAATPMYEAEIVDPNTSAPAKARGGIQLSGNVRMGLTYSGEHADAASDSRALNIPPQPNLAYAVSPDPMALPVPNTEAFPIADQNPIKVTAEEPVSTFSVDVDTASYAVIRSSLMRGSLPPEEAVRIEEMINYFPYAYAAPKAGEAPFKSSVTVMPTPWNEGTRLVRIGLQGRLPVIADRPPLNLVFLIDTSGSMQDADKLPLLKQSLRLLLPQLRPEDEVAIVAYAGSAGEVLAPTRAEDVGTIMTALERLEAGGSTAGAEGMELAYQVAQKMTAKGEVSRVLLATDGDFNVGISDPEGLEKYVEKKRKGGTYLSVLGFGRGNLDDATMQALAQSGNGMAAYIDTLQEARKVLVDQLSGALFPIADDVKIQVEWNPAEVAEYRLIGYETRALAREDFNNDKVDAGEIGAGHAVTAIYEVTAPGSPALSNDPLRYAAASAVGDSNELGFLRLRYKAPGESKSALIETPISSDSENPGTEAKFAAAIAGFGQMLTQAKYLGDWGWEEAIALALEGRGEDTFGYRIEAINLMRLAQSLAAE